MINNDGKGLWYYYLREPLVNYILKTSVLNFMKYGVYMFRIPNYEPSSEPKKSLEMLACLQNSSLLF